MNGARWAFRVLGAALGAALLWPLHNSLVILAGAVTGLTLPDRVAHLVRRHRQRRLRTALGQALPLLARLAAAEPVPYRALEQAAIHLPAPLGGDLERALNEHRTGMPLDIALHRLATRRGDDFYLHQFAAFTGTVLRQGGGLAGPMEKLTTRLRQDEELRAEAGADLFGFGGLIVGLFCFSFVPLPLSLVSGGPHWTYVTETAGGRMLLSWVVWSGLIVTALPGWLIEHD